jgi:hypothetical protein
LPTPTLQAILKPSSLIDPTSQELRSTPSPTPVWLVALLVPFQSKVSVFATVHGKETVTLNRSLKA